MRRGRAQRDGERRARVDVRRARTQHLAGCSPLGVARGRHLPRSVRTLTVGLTRRSRRHPLQAGPNGHGRRRRSRSDPGRTAARGRVVLLEREAPAGAAYGAGAVAACGMGQADADLRESLPQPRSSSGPAFQRASRTSCAANGRPSRTSVRAKAERLPRRERLLPARARRRWLRRATDGRAHRGDVPDADGRHHRGHGPGDRSRPDPALMASDIGRRHDLMLEATTDVSPGGRRYRAGA